MAFTLFGSATNPADNSNAVGATLAITPPASMLDGDLVVVTVRYRASTTTLTVSAARGQTWNQVGSQYNTTNIRAAVFWCRFNGTWTGGDPAFTVTSGTNNMDLQMLVFRPTSAAHTLTLESGPNGATYSAPLTPFTVTITGRTTVAASTVTIALWHSIDDNSWGSLAGTGWSKTNLTAQYRNNGTADNSSSIAYYFATSASTAIPNVSQDQTALGGDAGSTELITFAETLVTALPTTVVATAQAGSEALASVEAGIAGVEGTTAAGTAVGTASGLTNGSTIPDGVEATAQAGAATTPGNAIVIPISAGVGCSAGIVSASVQAFPVGASSTTAAGDPAGLASGLGAASPGGVAATGLAGSLAAATAIAGIAGVSSAVAAGAVVGAGGGILHGAGQPTGIFITASAGSPSMTLAVNLVGVAATAIAESLDSSLSTSEIDGATATGEAGGLVLNNAAPIQGVASSCVAGTTTQTWNAQVLMAGVESPATTGTVTAATGSGLSVAAEGVESIAQVGVIEPVYTAVIEISGVEATATANDAATSAGDTIPEEVSPSGVEATAQVGDIVTSQTVVSPFGVESTAIAGRFVISDNTRRPSTKHEHHVPRRAASYKVPRPKREKRG